MQRESRESSPVNFEGNWVVPDEIRLMDQVEAEHRAEFCRFYAGLAEKECWFMFFTSGLLNIVTAALRFIPETQPVVLIGSGLSSAEITWLSSTHANRPLHVIPIVVDDKTIWEFLFSVADHDFGWIDIDCFVLADDLLTGMRDPASGGALRGPFMFKPRPILRTHLLWIEIDVVRKLQDIVPTSPTTYSYVLTQAQRYPEHSFCRMIQPLHLQYIGKVLELDPSGRPAAQQEGILELYSNGITLQSTEREWSVNIFSGGVRRMFPIYRHVGSRPAYPAGHRPQSECGKGWFWRYQPDGRALEID